MTVAVVTDQGSIEIEAASGKCMGCKRSGGGMAAYRVHRVDMEESVRYVFCGNCLATGLADVIVTAMKRGLGAESS